MRKAFLALVLSLVMLNVFAAEPQSPRTFFPSKVTDNVILPVDGTIGQTCSASESPEHIALASMLSEPYTFEWTQSHIREQERAAIVGLFGAWLSKNLGSADVLFSLAHRNEDGSCSISVKVNGSAMGFVLSDGLVVAMKEL